MFNIAGCLKIPEFCTRNEIGKDSEPSQIHFSSDTTFTGLLMVQYGHGTLVKEGEQISEIVLM
jgi:hypothetical protein